MPFVPDPAPTSGRFVPDQPTPDETPKPTTPQFTGKPSDFLQAGRGVMNLMEQPMKLLTSALGGGMAAGPVSDVAGLGTMGARMAGLTNAMPQDVQRAVQQRFAQSGPIPIAGHTPEDFNPLNLVGKGVESLARGGESLVAPPGSGPLRSALGYGVKGAIEQAPNVIGALAGKRVAESLPERQAALDAAKKLNAPRDELARAADQAGYIRPPEHGLKAAVSGAAGKTKAEKTISLENEKNAQARLGREVGIPEGEAPTEEARDAAKEVQYKRYDELAKAAGPTLQVTNDFRDSIVRTLQSVNEDADVNPELGPAQHILRGFVKRVSPNDPALGKKPGKTAPGIFSTIEKTAGEQPGAPIMRTIERASSETPGPHAYGDAGLTAPPSTPVPTGRIPTLSTRWAMKQISELRKYAKNDAIARRWSAFDTRMGIANQLENLIEDNLAQKNQPAVGAFRQARVQLAKLHLLDRIADDATGTVNLQKLAQLSDTAAYRGKLTGEFKLAADFARTYKKAAQRLTGEAIPRFTVLDGLFAASGATSAMFGHPGGLGVAAGEIGARLAVPALARRGMLQNQIPTYQAGTGAQSLYPLIGLGTSGNQLTPPPQ